MDFNVMAVSLGGFVIGWYCRGLFPVQAEATPCHCNCKCAVQAEGSTTSFLPGIILAIVLGLAGLAANFVLAVKFTVSDGAKGENREVAISVKGKSKGIYAPPRALQITN